MLSKINLVLVWCFKIADRVGKDDTGSSTIEVDNNDNLQLPSLVIPAEAGILMLSKINLVQVWCFRIADRVCNDDTGRRTIEVDNNDNVQ